MADLQVQLQQAIAFHQAGQLAQAQALYEAVLQVDPGQLLALHFSGVAAAQTGNFLKAMELLDKAIALKPDYAEAYSSRGTILQQLGQQENALANYDQAIALNPGNAENRFNRGIVLRALGNSEAAIASYDQAVAINPHYADAFYNRGNALKALGRWEAAIASYDQAIALNPNYVQAHANRGVTLHELKAWDAALASHDHALALGANYAEAHYNRGIALKNLEQADEALACFDKAIALKPDYAEAHSSRGFMLHQDGQQDSALACFDKAIALKPDYAEAHFNKSLTLLLAGDMQTGWNEYEWRWLSDAFTSAKRNFPQPLWLGKELLAGKTILLHAEQGFGDTIQFCRYAPMIADLGATVFLEVQKPLLPLLDGLPGVVQLITQGDPLPRFDCHCPLLSLPLAFKTTLSDIPVATKYLIAPTAKIDEWQPRLPDKAKPHVGLAWRGRKSHNNDRSRSIALADLIKWLPEGFQYVSLQKEVEDTDRQVLASHPQILHFGEELQDFGDTAALCELMDAVISVDTSVAHLGAALGRPTSILLPFTPDWRWMLDREDSPWYPTATLYRQKKAGDWNNVFEQVNADLLKLAEAA